MTHTENPTANKRPVSVTTRMLVGAGLALLLIAIFLMGVNDADPSWGKYWMVRPLIVVPFAGAMGGLCNYFIMTRLTQMGLNKVLAIILSILVCVIGLWMGFILGFDGTLWN